MKQKDKFLLLMVLSCLPLGNAVAEQTGAGLYSPINQEVLQNTVKITGQVIDPNGEPIIGATVMEKGTTNGIVTDLDGNFSLTVFPSHKLQISYVGFQTQELNIGSNRSFKIVLKEDTELLDEVVVVGYGSVKKSDLTGAVASVSTQDLIRSGRTDAIGATASDKYKSMIESQSMEKIKSALRALKSRQANLPLLIEELKEAMDDDQSLQFLNSWNKCLIAKFVEEILRGDPDLNQAKFYYECIVCDDYEVLNWFKQECERILVFFPKCTPLKQYLSIVETLIHFNEQELFDYLYLQQYEIEKPYRFDYSLKLIPDSDTRNLRLYILDGNATASGSITHAGSEVPYTVESVSSSKLKIYDIDLSKYTDITSVTANTQGSYMALVPEGANFKATSYNPDGTVYARFDQSGNVEYYTYDAAGRVIKVEDQYGNILKTYEYNKLNN